MGLKTFEIEFAELGKDFFLRFDFDYFEIKKKLSIDNSIKLKKYLTFLETGKPITPDDYEEESGNAHIVVRNIVEGEFDKSSLIYISDEKAEELKKYRIEKGDLIIAISSNCGYSFLYSGDDNRNFTLSHYLARFRVNGKFVNPVFLNYYINSKLIKQYFRSVETGKTLKNLSKYYIKEMPVRIPAKEKQNQIVSQIEPIEKKIKELKAKMQPAQTIINKIFAREFRFDIAKFEELKAHKIFNLDFADFASNIDLRQSVKFHREAGKFALEQLNSKTSKKVKDFLSEPIVLGKGISPSEYDENGDVFYIAMSNIKNWKFEIEEARTVSSTFANANKNKTVAINDILLARSGEGTIGKVALIDDENIDGVFADFTMRIRLKNYNHLFAYYYFRSTYFQYLVEINKKGLGNNTNIFPSQIQEFPLFDISLDKQQQIVKEIKVDLDEQATIKKEIAKERDKIDKIIENNIM
ncbi:MAG: restriction endonuclease subunit S [Candidatus Fibromonas sp.]|jgi:restriction endonuclease S subunit|nr:restriction endonuclease subunit S [Candidatus Fibromonas sp.]